MSHLLISELRASPFLAKSVLLVCPHCDLGCEAVYPYGSSQAQKMQIRHDVITDHARVCTVQTAEVLRVWEMTYPRA